MSAKFYVYEHWRPDKGQCFYVGKGHGKRATKMLDRNPHHKAIQKKLSALGFSVEVRVYAGGLSEDEAFKTEVSRIAFWKAQGVRLANVCDGGRGGSGHILSEEAKAKIAAAHTGKKLKPEHLLKMSQAAAGNKNPFFGKTHSKETGEKIAEANRNRVWSEETLKKMSKARRNRPSGALGKKWSLSEDTKKRMSEAAKKRWANRGQSDASC